MKINWTTENISFPPIDRDRVGEWLARVAEQHGCTIRRLNYIFLDDAGMLELNNRALGHDYYTDIITFDYSADGILAGDIYISLDTVKSNAETVESTYLSELHRVIAHGLLHLCGINDKGPGEREIMEEHENQALATLPAELLIIDAH